MLSRFCFLARIPLLGFTGFLLLPAANAQSVVPKSDDPESVFMLGGTNATNTRMLFQQRNTPLKGTQYVWPKWGVGEVVLTSEQIITEMPLKFDAYSHNLVVKRPQGDSIFVDPARITEFTIIDAWTGKAPVKRHFRRVADLPGHQEPFQFLEVLNDEGPYFLLKRYGKNLIPAKAETPYVPAVPYNELTNTTEYYLLSPIGQLLPVKPTQRAFLAAVPADWAAALRQQLQKGAKIRGEDDLFNAVSRLNVLAAQKK
ncbi:hypothetical protein [Hymenobacter sp. BT730]|uniref:hypothetical protein n=1 Tax=Hymenobacter sp. BT730 TaxID=3063332 RepID=UPI0026DFAC7D|nr:hypothetical protein [Hymenobacter sp. BT730]